MMTEESSDISTNNVNTANSVKLQNLYILAQRARNEDNIADATRFYNEIRMEDPNSWEAAFYSVYYAALNCTIGEIPSAAGTIASTVQSVAHLIHEYVPAQEQEQAYTQCLRSVITAAQMLYGAALNALVQSHALDSKELRYNPITRSYDYPPISQAERDAKHNFTNRCKACDEMLLASGTVAEVSFQSYILAYEIYALGAEACRNRKNLQNLGTLYTDVMVQYQNIFEERLHVIEPKRIAEQQRKNDAYWENHAEQKQAYETRLSELDSELQQLQVQIAQFDEQKAKKQDESQQPTPAEKQLRELEEQQNDLILQKAALGLFDVKQKKALQERINALQPQIDNVRETANQQARELRNAVAAYVSEVNKERKVIVAKVKELEDEKSSICMELIKAR